MQSRSTCIVLKFQLLESDSDMRATSLISAAEDVLRQGCSLLNSISVDDYRRKEDGPYAGSIGAHYRHVLDHFICLLDGIWEGLINYDRRARSPELENSVQAALATTENLIEALRSLPEEILQQDCSVAYSVGYAEEHAQSVRSVVAREVMFCLGHAIHHYAILKLLCVGRAVTLPREFGVAPSTVKHLAAQAAH